MQDLITRAYVPIALIFLVWGGQNLTKLALQSNNSYILHIILDIMYAPRLCCWNVVQTPGGDEVISFVLLVAIINMFKKM